MPPTRRKASHPPTVRAQPTLTFGPRANKVTKPSVTSDLKPRGTKAPASDVTAQPPASEKSPAPEELDGRIENEPTTADLAIRRQAEREVEVVKRSDVEEKAEAVGEAQIQRFWKGKEGERKAPRVHQQDLSVNEKILRHFDLSSQYGPCIGIARMKRWKRADNLGLKPPIEVLAVLLREEKMKNTKAERAYVDELMSTRFSVE